MRQISYLFFCRDVKRCIYANNFKFNKIEFLLFLIQNLDIFVRSPYNVPRVDPYFIFHLLNISPEYTPKRQKPRTSSHIHIEAVIEKVDNLKLAGAIKEIFYLGWIANIVVVKMKMGKWRVCIDFMNLSKVQTLDYAPMI